MITSIIYYDAAGLIQNRTQENSCCSFIKGADYSGKYQKIDVIYPFLAVDEYSKRICDFFNFFFGDVFTINLITDQEEIDYAIDNSFAIQSYKNRGFMIRIEYHSPKGKLNQLLLPLTLSRWVVTQKNAEVNHEYHKARELFIAWLNAYKNYEDENPLLLLFLLDGLHQFYPVTTSGQSLYWDKNIFKEMAWSGAWGARPEVVNVFQNIFNHKIGLNDRNYGGSRYAVSMFTQHLGMDLYDVQIARAALLGKLDSLSGEITAEQFLGLYERFEVDAHLHNKRVNEYLDAVYAVRNKDNGNVTDTLSNKILESYL
jgi:hypothetical protein